MEASEFGENFCHSETMLDNEAIQQLRSELVNAPEKAIIQLGKYGVTVGNASEIHIGDIVNHNLDRDSINNLVFAIKAANDATGGMIFKHLARLPLEPLKINSNQVEQVNSDLELIDSLEKKGYLGATQQDAFTVLKQEVKSLNEFNQRLDKLHSAAKALLEESRMNLTKKIDLLKIEGEKILDSRALAQIAKERECKESELRIIEKFIQELEETGEIAIWIDKKRKILARKFGREALQSFPDIQSSTDSDKVSYFCFSIYQLLEQVSHCLKWGRYKILDSPDISLVFDYRVYKLAFSLIKETIDKDLPSHFNQASRKLANECIDYLIEQLPFYEQE